MIYWEPGKTLEEMEKGVILRALEFHDGNRAITARALGIAERTLYNRLKAYGLTDKKEDDFYIEEEKSVVLPDPNQSLKKRKGKKRSA